MKTILSITLLILGGFTMNAQENNYKFKSLPYSYDALEPHIDAKTMELHYSKHHKGYYDKFVAGMEKEGFWAKPIMEIFSEMSQYPDGIRNTAGGYWNHEFFWESLSPKESKPSEELQKAIKESFGSMEKMKEEFSTNAVSLFGSGWTWLIFNTVNQKLEIINTSNQDNPYMDVVEKNGIPLLAIDVWEHAYYLKYQNKRPDYIANFWNIVNWKRVSERYAATMK